MKRLLQFVTGIGLALLVGCTSPLYYMDGSEQVFLMNGPESVTGSESLQEQIGSCIEKVSPKVDGYLKDKAQAREFKEHYELPYQEIIGDYFIKLNMSADDRKIAETAVGDLFNRRVEKIVYPAWAQDVFNGPSQQARAKLKVNQFAEAREESLRVKRTSVDKVNKLLVAQAVALINKEVNVAQYAFVKKDMAQRFEKCLAENKFAEAIKAVEGYPAIQVGTVTPKVRDDMTDEGDGANVTALGTAALLKRVEAVKKTLRQQWEAKFPDWATYVFKDTETAVQATIADNRFAEAREAAWKGKKPGVPGVDKLIDAKALALINKTVNPAHWAFVEKTLTSAVDQKLGAKQFAAAKAYVLDYNQVRLGNLPKSILEDRSAAEGIATGTLLERLGDLKKALLAKIEKARKDDFDQRQRARGDALVKQVVQFVKADDYESAREAIRDFGLVKDAEWDLEFYKMRIGLLDSIVNPNQFLFLKSEAQAKIAEFVAAKKIPEACKFIQEYPYVHDAFNPIQLALDAVGKTMVDFSAEEGRSATYINGFKDKVNALLEAREGERKEKLSAEDQAALEKVLKMFRDGYIAQHFDAEVVTSLTNELASAVIEMSNRKLPAMTTKELNAALAAFLEEERANLNVAVEVKVARKEAAQLGPEADLDSQIAMAEGFIRRPGGAMGNEALMGDYARIMRWLKMGKACTKDEATTLLLGAICLNQEKVFKYALEQGADVNAIPRRARLQPLLQAIEMERYQFVDLLRAAKCDMTVRDAYGRTALHYAVERGNLALLSSLLVDIDLMVVDKAGRTVLFTAVKRNQLAVLKFLIARAGSQAKKFIGMKATVSDVVLAQGQDNDQRASLTVFDYACSVNAHMLLDTLVKTGAEYDETNLAMALVNDCVGAAQWLIEHGLDVNAPVVKAAAALPGVGEKTKAYLAGEGLQP